MTPAAAHTLLHALGLDARHTDAWRNCYVGDADPEPEVAELVELGLFVEVDPPGYLPAGSRAYRATDRGRSVALAERARRHPPLSRSKARYERWLDVADCWDITFGDFLRRGLYKEGAA